VSQMTQFVSGVEIWGTFIDAIVVADEDQVSVWKVSTAPDDFSEGFFGSIAEAAQKMGLSVGELFGNTRKPAYRTTVDTLKLEILA